jgi:hypothetical protein
MVDPRSTLTQQVSNELEEHFGEKVYRTIIPRNVRLAEAPSYGKPVIAFDRSSKGAQAYLLLAQEILDRRAGTEARRCKNRGTGSLVMKLKGLGRGLDALLAGNDAQNKEQLRSVPLADIQPGKYQPRTHMDNASLEELAASIRMQGLMQPILVRPVSEERYEIIAGERRWRAAQMAGLSEVSSLDPGNSR